MPYNRTCRTIYLFGFTALALLFFAAPLPDLHAQNAAELAAANTVYQSITVRNQHEVQPFSGIVPKSRPIDSNPKSLITNDILSFAPIAIHRTFRRWSRGSFY